MPFLKYHAARTRRWSDRMVISRRTRSDSVERGQSFSMNRINSPRWAEDCPSGQLTNTVLRAYGRRSWEEQRQKLRRSPSSIFVLPLPFLFSCLSIFLPPRSVSSQPRNTFIGEWKQMERETAVSLRNFKAWPCHARKWKSKVHFQVRLDGRQGRLFERVWNTMEVLESLVNRTYLEMYIYRREICWTYGGCNFV